MLPYNTDQNPLTLPEYGRNIQNLIEYCTSIEDNEERRACIMGIAEIMANLFPEMLGENNDYRRIWDHINIISGFKLNDDFPCEVITAEKLKPTPEKVPYSSARMRYRHYGKNLERMIDYVKDMPEGEEKEALISMIAHHMKKLMLLQNKEGVTDAKILKDLAEYSGGVINLNPATYLLHEFKEAPQPANNKKKGKRR